MALAFDSGNDEALCQSEMDAYKARLKQVTQQPGMPAWSKALDTLDVTVKELFTDSWDQGVEIGADLAEVSFYATIAEYAPELYARNVRA